MDNFTWEVTAIGDLFGYRLGGLDRYLADPGRYVAATQLERFFVIGASSHGEK